MSVDPEHPRRPYDPDHPLRPDEHRTRPSVNQPLNARRRPLAPALLTVLGIVVLVVGVVALLTYARYNT